MKQFQITTHRDLRTNEVVVVVEHQPAKVDWKFEKVRGKGKTFAEALRALAVAIEETEEPCFDPLKGKDHFWPGYK